MSYVYIVSIVRKTLFAYLSLRFTQSFNRPNLKMEVFTKKPSSATKDVISIIKEKFPGKCGIVYCLSRYLLHCITDAMIPPTEIIYKHCHSYIDV